MAFKREFGKSIPGLKIHGHPADYPVMDERTVRAAAGIMLAVGAFSFANAALAKQFIFLQAFVIIFFMEFAIRLFLNPDYAPIYALGKFLVRKQTPEWVGAIQKKFAWYLGIIMAGAMLIIAVIMGVRGAIPFSICSVCMFLLWAESALGICIGCKMYNFIIDKGWLKPKVKAACPGNACSIDLSKDIE